MRKSLFASLLIAGLHVPVLLAGAKQPPLRKWVDNTGTFSVRASLVDVDSEAQSLRLRLESGEVVELPMRRLSEKDREYLATVTQEEPPAGTTREVSGIHWFTDLADARRAAAGKAAPQDDKPIMCFRVLGNLSGFM